MIIANIGSADSLEKTDTVGPESVVVIRAETIRHSITEKLNLNSSASIIPASNAPSIPTCQQRAHSGAEDGVDDDGSDVLEEDALRLHVVSRLEDDRRQQKQCARLGVEHSRLSLHQPHRRHSRAHSPNSTPAMNVQWFVSINVNRIQWNSE